MTEQDRLSLINHLNNKFPDRNWMEIVSRYINNDERLRTSQRIAIEREINNQHT